MRSLLLIDLDEQEAIRLKETFELSYRMHFINGEDRIDAVMEQWPVDIVLLNMVPAPEKALNILKQLQYAMPRIPVLVVSNADLSDELAIAMQSGARDYIIQPFDIDLLRIKLNLLQKLNQSNKPKHIMEYQNIRIDHEQHKVTVSGDEVPLCYKEYKILQLLINKPKHIFSREDLKEIVWRDVPSLNTRTIDTHIASIRKKLGHSGKNIKSIRKVGYMLD